MSRHRSGRPTRASVVVLILGGVALSCGPGVDEQTVRIGVILPLTGPSAFLGESGKRGAELAVAAVNAGGRLGERRLEIVYGDSQGKAEESLAEYRRIWQDERVPAIIAASGAVASALPGLMRDQGAGEPPVLLSLAASAAGATQSSEMAFRCSSTVYQEAEAMARFAREDLGMLRVALYVQNDDHGSEGRQAFEREFVGRGGRIAIAETFEKDAEEHDPSTLWRLERASAQGIYVAGDSDAYGTAFRQIRDQGIHAELLTGSAFGDARYRELADEAAEGVYATTTLFESKLRYELPAVRDFIDSFREAKGEEPGSPAAFAYSAVTILARAIEDAAAATPVEIQRVLADPSRFYDLPIGRVRFNESRDAELRLVVQRFTAASFVPARRESADASLFNDVPDRVRDFDPLSRRPRMLELICKRT